MVKSNDYRMDGRTVEEFKKHIEKGNEKERLAVTLFKHFLKREFNFTGDFQENGVDMQGEFIEDVNAITTEADYLIGTNKLPMEVKTSSKHCTEIYLKTSQVNSYIKQGASLLYVNGIDSDQPAFTFLTLEDLKELNQVGLAVTPPRNVNGSKKSFLIQSRNLQWLSFNGREKRYV